MDLSSLNVDVLLHLMEFVNPVDRFNLVLSGILKGFENVNGGISLHERIDCFGIELGLRRGGMCELEIRSLMFNRPPDESLLKILERLAGERYLQNNQQLREFGSDSFHISSYSQVISSMNTLEKLELKSYMTFKDLAHVFQTCPKLTELNITAFEFEMDEIGEDLKNQLRPGFQRLRRLYLRRYIDNDSLPVIHGCTLLQELLTWLKKCVQLYIVNDNVIEELTSFVIDDSLTLDPNLARSLGILKLWNFPAFLVEWIISVCLNIHTLKIEFPQHPNSFHNKIARLEKLKKLDVMADRANELKELVRSCRQVEILQMEVLWLTVRDLAELEPAENMTDITLRWNRGPPVKEVLLVLKRWRHLSRLSVEVFFVTPFPPFEVLSDFIMAMKHLSYLHIVHDYACLDYDQAEVLRDQVIELIIPLRPNFKFNISCN